MLCFDKLWELTIAHLHHSIAQKDGRARFAKAWIGPLGLGEAEKKTDNDISIMPFLDKVQAMMSPCVTKLRTRSFYEHEGLGSLERMRQTI